MKIDKETAESMREGEILRELVRGQGWQLAKSLLIAEIEYLNSVDTLPRDMSLDEIGKQALIRILARDLVLTWLDAIEGRIEQHQEQSAVLAERAMGEIVRSYPQQG